MAVERVAEVTVVAIAEVVGLAEAARVAVSWVVAARAAAEPAQHQEGRVGGMEAPDF